MTPQQFVEMVAKIKSPIASGIDPDMMNEHERALQMLTEEARAVEALPPTGDVGELIEKCRRYADSLVGINDLICGPLMARCALLEAADALTAQAARIAELERDKETAISIMELNDRARDGLHDLLASATARADEAAKVRAATIEECVAVIQTFREPGQFKVSEQWKDDVKPSDVYSIAAEDVSVWTEEALRAKIGAEHG